MVVKREPVDDAGKVSNPVPGQPVAPTAPRGDTTVKSPVILIQSTNDGAQQTQSPKPLQKQQPQKQVQAKQQHPGPHQSITVSSGPTIQGKTYKFIGHPICIYFLQSTMYAEDQLIGMMFDGNPNH